MNNTERVQALKVGEVVEAYYDNGKSKSAKYRVLRVSKRSVWLMNLAGLAIRRRWTRDMLADYLVQR